MQLLILAAGAGSRFRDRGYTTPKPLLKMPDGRAIIQGVLDDCRHTFPAITHTIIACRAEDKVTIGTACPDAELVPFRTTTRGATETAALALMVSQKLEDQEGLVICNADQRFECPPTTRPGGVAALTFKNDGQSKWSYIQTNGPDAGLIVEKPQVVDPAWEPTVGVYTVPSARWFLSVAAKQIIHNERHGPNQEFYLAPLLNYWGGVKAIPVESFHGLGTPEDYEAYCAVNKRGAK